MQRVSTEARKNVEALGAQIRAARLRRRWTREATAARVGVSAQTITKIEQGAPTVAIGTVFETARILDIPLHNNDPDAVHTNALDQLALLPQRARTTTIPDNDF